MIKEYSEMERRSRFSEYFRGKSVPYFIFNLPCRVEDDSPLPYCYCLAVVFTVSSGWIVKKLSILFI